VCEHPTHIPITKIEDYSLILVMQCSMVDITGNMEAEFTRGMQFKYTVQGTMQQMDVIVHEQSVPSELNKVCCIFEMISIPITQNA